MMGRDLGPGARYCLAGLLLALSGCVSDGNPVRDAFVAAGVGPKPYTAQDFVVKSRPEKLDYLPVGAVPPPRKLKAKTAEEVKSTEAAMDKLRASNEAAAGAARRAAATPAPASPSAKPDRAKADPDAN